MKTEKVTFAQMGELLECRYQTVSDIVNGVTKKGFYFDDACKIHKVFFPKYDMEYLFKRQWYKLMFDKINIAWTYVCVNEKWGGEKTKKVDETLEDICDWIQKELDNDVNNDMVANMVRALAELVSARSLWHYSFLSDLPTVLTMVSKKTVILFAVSTESSYL